MDFRYLVECKDEFNNYLSGILVPHIFHGIKGMFKYAENVYEQIEQKNKRGAKIPNPGVINIFKKTLEGIKELNNHEIEEEYNRIKMKSGCSDFFDNLIRACFKSYVLFLTWDPKLEESMYTDNTIYNQIPIKDFIHKCYIISCDYFKENPELFLNSRSNKKDIFDIIKNCIEMAIKKTLPYNQILEDYLNIEFTKKTNNLDKELDNVKKLVYDMINNKKYGDRPNVATIEEDSEQFVNVDNVDPLEKRAELENFIHKEIEHESLKNSLSRHGLETSGQELKTSQTGLSGVSSVSGVQAGGDSLTSGDDSSSSEGSLILESSSDSGSESGKKPSKNDTSETSLDSDNITRSSMKSKELSDLMGGSTNQSLSKTSLVDINSPPAIRIKPTDKLNELGKLGSNKKDVKVTMNKKNKLPSNFEEIESFYDSLAK